MREMLGEGLIARIVSFLQSHGNAILFTIYYHEAIKKVLPKFVLVLSSLFLSRFSSSVTLLTRFNLSTVYFSRWNWIVTIKNTQNFIIITSESTSPWLMNCDKMSCRCFDLKRIASNFNLYFIFLHCIVLYY